MAEYKLGHFQLGARLALKTVAQAQKEFGTKHQHYTTSLFNLALFHNKLGEYSEAEKTLALSLSIVSDLYGKSHVEYLNTLCQLGSTYFYQEAFDKAENAYLEAKQLAIAAYNKNDVYAKDNSGMLVYQYAHVQNALGRLYKTMGQSEKASATYEEGISVLKSSFETYVNEVDVYPSLLNNLANVYASREEYTKALPLYEEILTIQAGLTGKRSLGYITFQNNLASAYKHTKQWDKAEHLWMQAMDTLAQMTGRGDGLYISMLNNLADLYFELEKYDLAEQRGLEAKKLQEDSFGKDNAMYQLIIFNLAQTYQFKREYEKANDYYHIALNKTFLDVEKNFAYLTEEGKKAFYEENRLYIDEFSIFALQKSGILPLPGLPKKQLSKQSLGDVYDIQLATKAIVLNATSKMRRRLLSSGDTLLIQKYQHWEALKNNIAQLSATLKKERSTKQWDSLNAQADVLEYELARSSASFRQGFQNKRVSWKEVQKKLQPGEAAVELVKYYNGILYVALIVTPETKKHPEIALIKSSKEQDLEKQFFAFYKNCIQNEWEDTLSYNRFWKPIAEGLQLAGKGKTKKVFVSPDGLYNQININTLKNPKTGTYVLDELDIQLLTNTKELVEVAVTPSGGRHDASLFGRPAYSLAKDTTVHLRTPNARPPSAKEIKFADLVGTEKEVKEIQQLLQQKNWDTNLHLGREATEHHVKNTQNPKVLHLATHGYFLPSDDDKVDATMQSGLVFAGANDPPASTTDDGVLTAYEAMNLDLDSTELVVLSACETALGKVEAGEGVYGFQRTLKISGAQTILMSLWQVDDQATQELMQLFYTEWLSHGDKHLAFRRAQHTMKVKYKVPRYWGAFVMVGQ